MRRKKRRHQEIDEDEDEDEDEDPQLNKRRKITWNRKGICILSM